jgi:hypothetical protein
MNHTDCDRESDVLHAATTGRLRADADLQAHIAACPACQDVATVAAAFAAARPVSDFRVPESSRVWLQAQVRAREDATRLAARPITVAQAVAFASVVGVLGALVGATSSWLQAGLHWVAELVTLADPRSFHVPDAITVLVVDHGVLIGAIGACLMLTSLTVYLVTRET